MVPKQMKCTLKVHKPNRWWKKKWWV